MSRHPLAALRRHPRRGVALAVLAVAVLLGVVLVAGRAERQEPGDRGGAAAGPPASAPEGPVAGGAGAGGPAPGAAGPDPSMPAGGNDGTPTTGATAGTTGPGGGGGPVTPGTATGGGGPGQPGGEAVGDPGLPSDPTGDLVDPTTPVPPLEPVRCASTGSPRTGALPSVDERDGRRWVTVGRLAGNCDLSSDGFRLQGIDTRLAWRSDADSFAVFLVDVVQGPDATAGFADGQCAGACSESQAIVPPAGDYRLEVRAGDAPWEVEVQEYRRP